MNTHYQTDQVRLYRADVLAWALWYRGEIEAGRAEPFHAIVTDPPYGLSDPPPIEKVLTAWLAGDDFNYKKKGFMGKSWDSLPPGPRYWRALFDIVHPGGYLFAFSGTRTADLLGISCRLGGWEPFDRIPNFQWVYGQGFPKSHNISKSLDSSEIVACPDCQSDGCETCEGSGQVTGVEREVVGQKRHCWKGMGNEILGADNRYTGDDGYVRSDITAPAPPLAQAFDGYGSALKPAGEPILLLRKPREGHTFAQCARRWGSGGLDIGACRVGTSDNLDGGRYSDNKKGDDGSTYGNGINLRSKNDYEQPAGRWPPNVHFSHTPHTHPCPTCTGDGCDECHGQGAVGGCQRVGSKRVKTKGLQKGTAKDFNCVDTNLVYGKMKLMRSDGYADPDGKEQVADWLCVEGCAVRLLGEMSGERPSSGRHGESGSGSKDTFFGMATMRGTTHFDTGTATRYFVNHDWELETLERRMVDKRFCPCYNEGKDKELNQCCENASLAIANLMLKYMMSNEALDDSVTPSAQEKPSASGARLTPGDSRTNETDDGTDFGENRDTEKHTGSLKTDGSGNLPMDPSQTDTTFTTKTKTQTIMTCPICNACLRLSIGPYTIASEKITKYCLTVQRLGVASDVKNTSQLNDSQNERREHTTDIANPVGLNMLDSGENATPSTSKNKGENDTGKSRDLNTRQSDWQRKDDHDWSYEIAARLAGETPFRYVAKASRGERDAGCQDLPRKFLATMGDGIGEREHNEEESSAWVGNSHACVKPISLIRWLAALCKPPDQFKPRICIPYCGSGSEVIGAILAGWTEIHAIDNEREYLDIAAARIAWWSKWATLTGKTDPAAIRKLGEAADKKEAWRDGERQTSMFEALER